MNYEFCQFIPPEVQKLLLIIKSVDIIMSESFFYPPNRPAKGNRNMLLGIITPVTQDRDINLLFFLLPAFDTKAWTLLRDQRQTDAN